MILRALLQATDYGVLASSVDRQDLIANRRLGELFNLTPQEIVEMEPEAVRALARTRFRDPAAFDLLIDAVNADPDLCHEDELELGPVAADEAGPVPTVRRYTAPVRDQTGALIGRLWTFLDITETRRLQSEIQAQLQARTEEFLVTSEMVSAMSRLCRIAHRHCGDRDLLEAVVEVVAPLPGCRGAALLIPDDNGGFREVAARAGSGASTVASDGELPAVFARALAAPAEPGASICVHTVEDGSLVRRLDCTTLALTALRATDRVLGVLVLAVSDPGCLLDPRRMTHLRAVIDQVALTLETQQLQSELRQALETLNATQRQMVEMEKLRTAGTLATSVAHDIRNILTPLQIEVASQPDLIAAPIGAQLARFAALTHRLLAFARPGILDIRPTPLATVVGRVVPLLKGQAELSSVEITLDFPESLPPLAADASQMEHLLVNLCLNALQAMSQDGGRLSLRGRSSGPEVEITVEDTGCGIPPEHLERLFDPFFTTRANGFGLGLFSCRRIVEEHNGRLAVDSAPGRGSRFIVTLPAAEAHG